MAIQKCVHCGHWVSSHAPQCRHCGQPISPDMIEMKREKARRLESIGWTLSAIGYFLWEARLVILAIIAFILIVFWPLVMIFKSFSGR
ncbi:MAG: hypothetical protein Kow0059_14220 [Candidatus Sumerlaeia bacterium]